MATLKFNITPQDVEDILVTAFEGGINYWCWKAKVKDGDYKGAEFASGAVAAGATVILFDDDDDTHEIDLPKMLAAIEWYATEQDSSIIDLKTKGIDDLAIDAGIADSIVQYAALGDIVYG
jgi:hypothetical protein